MISITLNLFRCIANCLVSICIIMCLFSVKSYGQNWTGLYDRKWENPNNWYPNYVPWSGDYIDIISTSNIPVLSTSIYPDVPGFTIDTLRIDYGGTFIHNDGYLPINMEFIGLAGYGSYSQWGGTNKSSLLRIGESPGSEGHYYLGGVGSRVLTEGQQFIGFAGTGTFTQSGGTNESTGRINIGYNPGSSGTYTLLSGMVSSDQLSMGWRGGSGTFKQYGGENIATTGIYLGGGGFHGGTGTYDMHNGNIQTTNLISGYTGTGIFNQWGGQISADRVILGGTTTGNGTYNLYNGSLSANVLEINIGTFSQHGGTNTIGNALFVNSNYSLSDGNLQSASTLVGAHTKGTITQTGGLAEYKRFGTLEGITLGAFSSGVGTYNLNGGTVLADGEIIGGWGLNNNIKEGGTGIFNHNGGINAINGNLIIKSDALSNGTYNLSGGSLNTSGDIINNGIFNYFGGNLYTGAHDLGTFINHGELNIIENGLETRFINANVYNDGHIKTSDATINYTGNFINNGAYISDPSTNIFNHLTIGSSGYLVGALGDVFKINGDLIVNSLNNGQWNTSSALLEFSSGIHTIDLSGSTVNFQWSILQIDDGGYFSNTSNGNVFTDVLNIYDLFGFLTESNFSGIHINYGSLYAFDADGSSYFLTEEQLTQLASRGITHAPVPESSTMLLLGSGLAGLVGYCRRRFK